MRRTKLRGRERRVLRALAERERNAELEGGGPRFLTVAELAKALDVPGADAAEVVRALADRDLVRTSGLVNKASFEVVRVSATELGRRAIA